jgi:hypothetical protein
MVDSATATVTIAISAVNDAPIANQTTVYLTADNHRYDGIDFSANVTDPDGDPVYVTLLQAPSLGYFSPSLMVDSWSSTSTEYSYYGTANGEDTFVFQYSDGTLTSASVTAKVLVYEDSMDLRDPIIQNFEVIAAGPLDNPAFLGNPPNPTAVSQGQINDCWFVAAAVSLASKRPNDIVGMIHVDPDDHVTMPRRSEVSFASPSLDVLPADKSWSRIGAGGPTDPEWIAVLEKAYGSNRFEYTVGGAFPITPFEYMDSMGLPRTGIVAVTGKVDTYSNTLAVTRNSVTRDRLEYFLSFDRVVTAGTGLFPGNGIISQHVYSVLQYDRTNDRVQLQNPHGNGEGPFWKGFLEFVSDFWAVAYETTN